LIILLFILGNLLAFKNFKEKTAIKATNLHHSTSFQYYQSQPNTAGVATAQQKSEGALGTQQQGIQQQLHTAGSNSQHYCP
jgi:hypothetical protein